MALWRGGAWRAALLRGGSGAGKSDLALRLMAAGGRLVGDDRIIAWASGGRLFARAHPRLEGLVEARGLGVVPTPCLAFAEVVLVCDLVAQGAVERVPEPASVVIEGVRLKQVALFGGEDSAPAKLDFALRDATLGARPEASYQTRSAGEATAPLAGRGPLKRNR